jgi:hypothetical protein
VEKDIDDLRFIAQEPFQGLNAFRSEAREGFGGGKQGIEHGGAHGDERCLQRR